MLPQMSHRVTQWWHPWCAKPTPPPPPPPAYPLPLVRPPWADLVSQPAAELPRFLRESSTAMHYLHLLGALDWAHFPERPTDRAWPGPVPQPRAPIVAAFLVKLDQGFPATQKLYAELIAQPALTWLLGFPLVPSAAFSWGFDVAHSLPTVRHFNRLLRTLPQRQATFLLRSSVQLLKGELPPAVNFGDCIDLDTKHILAWVKENNPKTTIKGKRFDPARQPKGDQDCKVGFKANDNQPLSSPAAPAPPTTPTTEGLPATAPLPKPKAGEYYWGYASGVVTTKVPDWGEFVLADLTQTFDHADESYFFPLLAQTEANLGCQPRFGALDGAYDTFYVHEYFVKAGGFAAVPWADQPAHKKQFSPEGLPLCAAGLAMPLKATFFQKSNCLVPHEVGRYACPLRFPEKTGQACPLAHKNWQRTGADQGCLTTLPTSVGNRARHELDRDSPAYHALYDQRSASERINSQAVALGIERPKLRNQRAIAFANTLRYVLINLRGLQRVHERKAALAKQAAAPPH